MFQATFQGKRWDHEVASTPKRQMSALAGMSALPSEADMLIVGINVCYVPQADIAAVLLAQSRSTRDWQFHT